MTADNTTEPPPLVRVRAVLDGSVTDGATVAVHGTLDTVTVAASVQSGQWASGWVAEAEDSIEFMMFPRAFARTDRSCIETGGPVTVTARVSISAQRKALVINRIERLEPRSEAGVDRNVV